MSTPGLTFDPSEFPPILNDVRKSQNRSLSGNFSCRTFEYQSYQNSQSFVNTVSIQNFIASSPDFSIDQDFPALPVATSSVSSLTNSTAPISSISALLTSPSDQESIRSVDQSNSGGGLQFLSDDLVTNIPKNMIHDRFGMIGLLKLLQIGLYDKTFEMLAPGLDLPSLGVSIWQLPGELHMSFLSPSNESCMGSPQDIDCSVPLEYLIRHVVADRLCDPSLSQLSEETLFWLFYNCCREEIQLVAAKELYQRDWRFHITEHIWLTRKPGFDVSIDGNSERSTYYYWQPSTAEKLTKVMNLFYSDLDNAPETFSLSSNTLNARVRIVSALQTSTASSFAPAAAASDLFQPPPDFQNVQPPIGNAMLSATPSYRHRSSLYSASGSSDSVRNVHQPPFPPPSHLSSICGLTNNNMGRMNFVNSTHMSRISVLDSLPNSSRQRNALLPFDALNDPSSDAHFHFRTVGKPSDYTARHNSVSLPISSTPPPF